MVIKMNTDDHNLQLSDNIDLQKHKDALKKNTKVMNQYIVALVACFCPIISTGVYGYMTATWPRIVDNMLEISATSEQIAFLTSIAPACSIVGPLINTYFINIIGRKYIICSFYIPYLIMGSLLFLGNSYNTFFLACCFGMFNWLFAMSISSVYMSEISAPHLRSSLCAMVSVACGLGLIIGYIAASVLNIKQTGFGLLTCCIIALIASFLNLESPYFLLQKSKTEQAKRNLHILYRENVVEMELKRLQQAVDINANYSNKTRGWTMEIFRDRKCLVLLMLNMNLLFLISFSGGDPLTIIQPTLLRKGCYNILSPEIAEIILPIVFISTGILFNVLVMYIHRRILYIFSVVSTAMAVLSLGIYYMMIDTHPWLANICDFLPLGILMWFSFSMGLGIVPMPFIYFREFMPANVVGISTFLLDIAQPIFAFASIAIFEILIHSINNFAGFLFLLLCLMFSVLIYVLFTPEMQGKFLEEVELQINKDHKSCQVPTLSHS